MKHIKEYKIFENIGEKKKSFNIVKKLYEFVEKDVIKIIDSYDLFHVRTYYPGINYGTSQYQFETDRRETDELTDDEIVNQLIEDGVDLYQSTIAFGVRLTLKDREDLWNMGISPLELSKNKLKDFPSKYQVLDIEEESNGDIWFVIEYNISGYFDKLGKVFNKINSN